MFKHLQRIFSAVVLSLFILVIAGNGLAQDDLESATIAATDEGLAVPEVIPAGWVEITFENETEIPLFVIMGRLDDGATMDEFMEALMGMMGGDSSIVPPATLVGSPTALPESAISATYQLEAGMYILLNVAGEEPEIATFMVEGETSESDFEPESDRTIELLDFAFTLPTELPAGEQTWLIDNVGKQWHEMVFIPVPEGSTIEDAMAMMMAGEGDAEAEEEGDGGMMEFAFVWAPMSGGERAWVNVDLAPGTYLVTCFIEDSEAADGSIHAEKGMIQIVNVVESEEQSD